MVRILSNDSNIEANLRRQIALITEAGGFVHPKLTLVVDVNGELSVESSLPAQNRDIVLSVPRACLPPLDEFAITLEDDRLVAEPVGSSLTDAHIELARLMFELFELTGKIAHHCATFPILNLRRAPVVFDYLVARSGQFKGFTKRFGGLSPDEQVIRSFFDSRTFELKRDGEDGQTVLLPILELLNHHAHAVSFSSGQGEGVSVSNCQPSDSNECFVNYAHNDALKSYVGYGFLDESSDFVRIVPTTIELAGVGVIRVDAQSPPIDATKVLSPEIADLRFLMPSVARRDTGEMRVSHLLIPPAHGSHSLRRILEVLIRTLRSDAAPRDGGDDLIGKAVVEAESKVVTKTERYYRKLEQLVGRDDAKALSAATRKEIAELAKYQLRLVSRYRKKARNNPTTYIGRGRRPASV
ncbi:MAG: hypothetical protein AAF493_04840 [Pseudomonadota bacterium]